MTVGWRSWRWVWVMRQMAVQVPWQWALRALWIGQMTNALVPAKLGEAVKLGLLKRRGVPIGLGAILILVDRLLDGMSIALLGLTGWVGMQWAGGHISYWVGGAVLLGALAFLGLGVAIMVIPQWAWVPPRIAQCPQWIQPALTDWLAHAQQVRKRSHVRLVGTGLGIGALNWVGEMGLLWGIAKVMGVSMPWWLAVLTVAFTAFGGLVLSAPAGVGTVHFLLMTALVSGGIPSASAGVVTLWMHASGLIIQVIMGAMGVGVMPHTGRRGTMPTAQTDSTGDSISSPPSDTP